MAIQLSDEMVYEIMQRLPPKSILKFSCVSKSWCSISEDPTMRQANARGNQKTPLVQIFSILSSRHHERFPHDFYKPDSLTPLLADIKHDLIASCDGLLLLCLTTSGKCSICNPLTQQWIEVPLHSESLSIVGFYLEQCSQEYRLLATNLFNYYRNGSTISRKIEILTLGANQWRDVKLSHSISHGFGVVDELGAFDELGVSIVLLQQNLHWFPWRYTYILAFDTSQEKFRKIKIPHLTKAYWNDETSTYLLDMEGKLAFSIKEKNGNIDVWILDDYVKETSWSIKYSFCIECCPKPTLDTTFNYFGNGMMIHDMGENDLVNEKSTVEHFLYCLRPIMMKKNGDIWLVASNTMAVYNIHLKTWRNGYCSEPCNVPNALYKESLVIHDFFMTENNT